MIKLPRSYRIPLTSGATLLYQRNPFSPTIAFGLYFTKGSRDEESSERGLSHLLEHMVFRGTRRRSALQIALDLESIGGQWDAFTGKESTCYHGKVLAEHFEELSDIFADIVLNPSVPVETFRLEKKVVQEEIRSVMDSPEDSVHELFFKTIFKGHPLGHPVTGSYSDVGRFTRRRLLEFHRKTYTARNALLGFVGNLPAKQVAKIVDEKFRFRRKGRSSRKAFPGAGSARVRFERRRDWSQSHVCIGSRIVSASDPRRHALIVLSNILGGGVSSRFFQSLRERAGLVYSVYTGVNFWTDAGSLYTYFSVDPKNLKLALEIFHEELREVGRGNVREEEIESAKAQIKGAVIFGIENVNARLFRLFQNELYYERHVPLSDVLRSIEKVDKTKIAELAHAFLDEKNLSYVTTGPVPLGRFV